jgi:hypothetical protein
MKLSILALLTASLWLITQRPSQARIGWTLEECREHYGKEVDVSVPPAGPLHELVLFHAGNFYIGVKFLDGKVGYIHYGKRGEDFGKKLSHEELSDLLEKNGSGCVWKPEGENGTSHETWFEDQKLLYVNWTGFRQDQPVMSAFYVDDSLQEKPSPMLTIQTLEFEKWEKEDIARITEKMTKEEQNKLIEKAEQEARQGTQGDVERRNKSKEAADKNTQGL